VAFELNRAEGWLPTSRPVTDAREIPAHGWSRALLVFAFVVYLAVVLTSALGLAPLSSALWARAVLVLGLAAAALALAASRTLARTPAEPVERDALRVAGNVAIAAGALCTVAAFVLALLLPIGAYDALGYRLPAVAQWLDAGAVVWVEGDDPLRNGYPLGLEVLEAVLFRAFGSPSAVDAVSSVFVAAGAASLCGFARTLGLGRAAARLTAGLFLLVPMHLLNAPSGYADAALAGALVCLLVAVARFVHREGEQGGSALDLGVAASLVIALKPHGFAFAALSLAVGAVLRARARGLRAALVELAPVALLATPGLFFAARNVAMTGNPVYPLEVRVAGHVLFAGQASLDGILTPDYNVPAQLRALPALLRPMWVWLQPEGPARSFDDRMAGFGYAFVAVGLPALAFAAARLARRRGARPGLGIVLVLTLVCWGVQPFAFWPRFTSWLWGAAALAIALLVRELDARARPQAALAVAGLALALALPEAMYALAHVKNLARLGPSVVRADDLTRLARVAGIDAGFVQRALSGRSDVCRTPWRLGTDDANLDGVVAQLSPRPRMHVVDDVQPEALASLLRAHGCRELIAIGDSPLVTQPLPRWADRIERATAFGPCHLITVSSAEVFP